MGCRWKFRIVCGVCCVDGLLRERRAEDPCHWRPSLRAAPCITWSLRWSCSSCSLSSFTANCPIGAMWYGCPCRCGPVSCAGAGSAVSGETVFNLLRLRSLCSSRRAASAPKYSRTWRSGVCLGRFSASRSGSSARRVKPAGRMASVG
jgi:hypothetical protein